MVEIIIKRKIAGGLNSRQPPVPRGTSIPIERPNGDFGFDTTEDKKTFWDSLKESRQSSIIKKYLTRNEGLEEILTEEMNK